MPKVVGVRLRYSKTLWFDPRDLTPGEGDIVIVETERGQEIGLVQHGPHEVEESALKAELKPVVRIATEEDMNYVIELGEKEKAAMPKFKELIDKNKLEMKPVDIEYLFGGDKIVFYFSAEERVDFRSLVKDLASYFHMRIDMRQVGVRDEARMVGGLGHCGEVLCCARLGGEFAPVSIKMAKDQGLPLNPLKISGRCGRLMCCLRYEVEAYQDFNARSPRKNATVATPQGDGKVVNIDALREIITLQFHPQDEDAPERLDVPLCKMNCEKKDGKKCCCSISPENYAELTEEKEAPIDTFFFPTPSFKTLDSECPQQKKGNGNEEKGDKDKRTHDGEKDRPSRSSRRRRRAKDKSQTAEKENGASTSARNEKTREQVQGTGKKAEGDKLEKQDKQAHPKRRRRPHKKNDASGGSQKENERTAQRSEERSSERTNQRQQRPTQQRPAQQKSPQQRPRRNSGQGASAQENRPSARSVEPGQRIPRRRKRTE